MNIIERTKQRKKAGLIPKYNHTNKAFASPETNDSIKPIKLHLPTLDICEYEGPIVESCKSCNNGQRDVRICLHPNPSDPDRDNCTRGYVSDKIQACVNCPDRKIIGQTKQRFEFVNVETLNRDSIILAGLLPPEITGVAGIPRSGMIPAALIAVQLHLPLYQFTEEGKFELLSNGYRGREHVLKINNEKEVIAIIDDTSNSGLALDNIKQHLDSYKARFIFAVVYRTPTAPPVDYYTRELEFPHLLEWNLINTAHVSSTDSKAYFKGGFALDIDGIIVHDHLSKGKILSPYLVPRTFTVPVLITGRKESTRVETENLLHTIGAKWEKLIMFPDELYTTDNMEIARFKAQHFVESNCGLFVESDPIQADYINKFSNKPVVCPAANKVFY